MAYYLYLWKMYKITSIYVKHGKRNVSHQKILKGFNIRNILFQQNLILEQCEEMKKTINKILEEDESDEEEEILQMMMSLLRK